MSLAWQSPVRDPDGGIVGTLNQESTEPSRQNRAGLGTVDARTSFLHVRTEREHLAVVDCDTEAGGAVGTSHTVGDLDGIHGVEADGSVGLFHRPHQRSLDMRIVVVKRTGRLGGQIAVHGDLHRLTGCGNAVPTIERGLGESGFADVYLKISSGPDCTRVHLLCGLQHSNAPLTSFLHHRPVDAADALSPSTPGCTMRHGTV